MWLPVFLIMSLGLAGGALLARASAWPPLPFAALGGLLAMLGYGWLRRRRLLHREALWAEAIGALGAGAAIAPLLAERWFVGMVMGGGVWAIALAFRWVLLKRFPPA